MMNLADPELELIDPTPNVHSMFLHFDKTFFWGKLSCRCIVRWSKRMYSCAGICSYEGRGGVCDIALSEPLLKLRPRKDLVETLLHEMIHAFLFITCQVQDRDGHGPNFQAHMHRINRAAGLNISIYHDFHDEVKLYQTHWWRCNGPCQAKRPHFGIVRRSANRAPGPSDYWWYSHQRSCGGTFIKIKEPEKRQNQNKKPNVVKPNADITKYITNNNNKDMNNKNIVPNGKPKRVLKDSNNVPNKRKEGFENNKSINMLVTNKNVKINLDVPFVFSGAAPEVRNVLDTVRNVWANKQIGTNNSRPKTSNNNGPSKPVNNVLSAPVNNGPSAPVNNGPSIPVIKRPFTPVNNHPLAPVNNVPSTPLNKNKHKADNPTATPPSKMKKIEEYFTATATSMLKDLYGKDFKITVSKNDQKFVAQPNEDSLVDCPVCNKKVISHGINAHLDECLNRIVIDHLTKPTIPLIVSGNTPNGKVKVLNKSIIVGNNKTNKQIAFNTNNGNGVNRKRPRTSLDESNFGKPTDLRVSEDDVIDKNKRKSDSFIAPTRPQVVNSTTEEWIDTLNRPIKVEPGCSNPDSSLGKQCPCCGDKLNKSVDEHLDECLSFFHNDTTIPEEGASTSFTTETIVIDDDDDQFDETSTLNATGTKLPCPSCLKMVEEIDMNTHLDVCLT